MKFNGASAILAVALLLSVVKSQALDSGLDLLGPEIASTGFVAASGDLAIHSKNNASDSLSGADLDAVPQLASFSPSEAKQYRLKQLYDENVWKNSLVMWVVPEAWRDAMPHWAQVRHGPRRLYLCPAGFSHTSHLFSSFVFVCAAVDNSGLLYSYLFKHHVCWFFLLLCSHGSDAGYLP